MKKSDILLTARGLIQRKTKDTISTALIGVAILSPGAAPQIAELHRWIDEMMGGAFTYERWLWKFHPAFAEAHDVPKFNVFSVERGYDICREARLAWLDWMIEIHRKDEALHEGVFNHPSKPPAKIQAPPSLFKKEEGDAPF